MPETTRPEYLKTYEYNKDKLTLEFINERVKHQAEFLQRLDRAAFGITIDGQGKIFFTKQDAPVGGKQAENEDNFNKLVNSFRDSTLQYAEKVKNYFGVLDVRIVGGAIAITFDSSKQVPQELLHFIDEEQRGGHVGATDEIGERFLGVIIVDTNSNLRKDGVTPTVSMQHEWWHH
ncbi:MAG TPA: hypothetical protein VEA59_01545, partial [Patescibacteria group bacterium]|nr:hypothetical protein [Patescibacteria group bacterium]